MIKLLSVAAFLVISLYAADASAQCVNGMCGQRVFMPVPVYQPQTVMVPSVQYRPYQLQGMSVQRMQYRTPVRDLFFGRYRTLYYYAPQPMQGVAR